MQSHLAFSAGSPSRVSSAKVPVSKGSLKKSPSLARISSAGTRVERLVRSAAPTAAPAIRTPSPPPLPAMLKVDAFEEDLSHQRCLSGADLVYLGVLSSSDILMEVIGLDSAEEE